MTTQEWTDWLLWMVGALRWPFTIIAVTGLIMGAVVNVVEIRKD